MSISVSIVDQLNQAGYQYWTDKTLADRGELSRALAEIKRALRDLGVRNFASTPRADQPVLMQNALGVLKSDHRTIYTSLVQNRIHSDGREQMISIATGDPDTTAIVSMLLEATERGQNQIRIGTTFSVPRS